MGKEDFVVSGLRCERCGATWIPRMAGLPRTCAKCKSPYWNEPRQKADTAAKVLEGMTAGPTVEEIRERMREEPAPVSEADEVVDEGEVEF